MLQNAQLTRQTTAAQPTAILASSCSNLLSALASPYPSVILLPFGFHCRVPSPGITISANKSITCLSVVKPACSLEGPPNDPVNPNGAILTLGTGVSLSLSGITLKNGCGSGRGCSRSHPAATDAALARRRHNAEQGGGGAISAPTSGTVTAEWCLFLDNSAVGYGGAVNLDGGSTGTFTDCAFVNNNADEGATHGARERGIRRGLTQ